MSYRAFVIPSSEPVILRVMALAAAVMVESALVAQYGFGLYPCELCIYQRYPYVLVMALAFPAAYMKISSRLRRCVILLCSLLFLLDAGIAFYHAGVELEWFTGPDACSNVAPVGQSLEEMRRQIMEAPLVTCSQAMAYVFGLSLAAWNALLAFLLAGWGFMAWRKLYRMGL